MGVENINSSLFQGLKTSVKAAGWTVETLDEGETGRKTVTKDESLVKSEVPFKDFGLFFFFNVPSTLKLLLTVQGDNKIKLSSEGTVCE